MTLPRRFFLLAASLLLGTFLLVGVGLRGYVEGPRLEAERERMLQNLEVASRLLLTDPTLPPNPRDAAPALGRLLGLRVTLLAPDGTVLGDSGVPGGDVRNMESHATRPEVLLALEGRTEVLQRRSATQGIPTFYVASLVRPEAAAPYLVRLSAPTGAIRGPLDRAPLLLGALGLLALLVLEVGLGLIARSFRRDAQRLEEGVRQMAEGVFDALPSRDGLAPELSTLGRALERLGEEVEGRGREILRDRSELLSILDAMAEGVLALTEDARILRINQAAIHLLDLPQPEPFAPVGALIRSTYLRDYLEEAVVLPLPPREFVLGPRTLRVSAHQLEPGGAVVTVTDVTELRRMEKVRRDFVANASHELKTPLTSMRGFAEALLEGDPPGPLRQQFLASIQSNAVRMQNLVDDLLDLSRLESGTWVAEEDAVDVAPVARDVWTLLTPRHAERNIRFEVVGDGVVLADAQALAQVFQNLLDNALRHTPDGGSIRVDIRPRGPELAVEVRDSGSGIPAQALPRIFERFYRVDAGRDRGAGGTGLGLAIVRHLVQAMGGEVEASSVLGEGTAIRFRLPRLESAVLPPAGEGR
jgi:two-component system, OmpR family, phosphate regulon sensor histidine kinase PhoR